MFVLISDRTKLPIGYCLLISYFNHITIVLFAMFMLHGVVRSTLLP